MPTPVELISALKNSKDPDAMVLSLMIENGSDITKPHEPDFAFEVNNQIDADKIADELVALGFQVEIYTPNNENPENKNHQVVAKRIMVLDLQVLNQLTLQFEALAKNHGAIYDGWGAEIVE